MTGRDSLSGAEWTPVAPGDVVLGKYRVEGIIGRGGMGVVVSAVHQHLGQRVALKFLHGDSQQNTEAFGRFFREAQSSARIQSEHVARVSDVGTLPSGEPYIVMEYLEGRDLADVIAKEKRLSVETVVDYVLQACDAIAEAHALGIVHRDLKPANLFLTNRLDGASMVKVLDFGISKAMSTSKEAASLTGTKGMLGTPYYMSPEQVKSSKSVDARSDIWALGAILHELLSGEPPFQSDNVYGLLLEIGQTPATPLRRLRPDLPVAIESIVLRCLEKEPARRWQTVALLAEALAPFAPHRAQTVERISRLLAASSTGFPLPDAEAPTKVMMPGPIPVLVPQQPQAVLASSGQGTIKGMGSTTGEPIAPKRATLLILGLLAGALAFSMALFAIFKVVTAPAPPQTATAETAPSATESSSATPAASLIVAPAPATSEGSDPAATASATPSAAPPSKTRTTPAKPADVKPVKPHYDPRSHL